jgi:hypothetical protein
MSNWQRIETAEKDEGARLPYEEEPMRIGLWDGRKWVDIDGNSFWATHWMPLPEPPK